MKQFLYMDTDIVNSIIAQAENGLLTNSQQENSNTESQEVNASANVGVDGKVGGSFFKVLNAEANMKGTAELGVDIANNVTVRSINEKKIHDAAFDRALKYIDIENGELWGEYTKIKGNFNFVDLDYLVKLFSEDMAVDFIIKSKQEKIGKLLNTSLRMDIDEEDNISIEEKKKRVAQNYRDIAFAIKGIRSMIPYSKMLVSSDGYLIPLDEKYFRVNPSSVSFMYGGEMNCVGMISNIIGENMNDSDSDNVFEIMQDSINDTLRSILPTKQEDLIIINPIAVYYES